MKKLLILALTLVMVLAGCQKKEEPKEEVTVRFGVLKGPTGIGASYLLDKNSRTESLNKYEVTVEAEATNIIAAVVNGSLDIAAVPTNAAATLYNKTNGGVSLIALNTGSVLYILEKGDTIKSFADLKGRKIYSVGQGSNPEYVLRFLLEKNGVTDAEIEFMDSAELQSKAASGDIDVCMLPVPAVTTVLMKNAEMRVALNMGEEWDKVNTGSILTMGGVIVNREFAKKYPKTVENFLKEYEESINYVKGNPAEAGALCEKFEIVPKAAVATKAIPDAGLIFVAGDQLKSSIAGYLEVLYNADAKSVGGKLPNDDFYSYK